MSLIIVIVDLEEFKVKTRIISGVIIALVVGAVLSLGFLVNPLIITAAVAILAAIAVYELIHNAAGIKCKASIIGAIFYSVLVVFILDKTLLQILLKWIGASELLEINYIGAIIQNEAVIILSVFYFVYAVCMVLKNNKEFGLGAIISLCAMPLILSYAFSSLSNVINFEQDGIYYLLMMFNFASVCDMGAYFVGSAMGKTKLCPNVSPKKTVEGAFGGIISSMIVSAILSAAFSKDIMMAIILTIPFCVIGMLGDLFASAIKRSVDLKDYGSLIPGHGGILDRLDSMLLIAPVFYIVILSGVI
jgi:phosphatidate cytidylyltransferase